MESPNYVTVCLIEVLAARRVAEQNAANIGREPVCEVLEARLERLVAAHAAVLGGHNNAAGAEDRTGEGGVPKLAHLYIHNLQ